MNIKLKERVLTSIALKLNSGNRSISKNVDSFHKRWYLLAPNLELRIVDITSSSQLRCQCNK